MNKINKLFQENKATTKLLPSISVPAAPPSTALPTSS